MSITVIIPAHNADSTIRATLDSVCSNTLVRQIIVVDDCSTDATADRVADYARRDGRVELARREQRQGAGAARNAGFPHAGERYCIFLDADDDLKPKALDGCAAVLDAYQADFLVFKWYYCDMLGHCERQRMLEQDEDIWQSITGGSKIVRADIRAHPDILRTANFPWHKLYSTDFLRRAGIHFSETLVHNDNLAHWMSYVKSGSFILYDEYLIGHREDRRKKSLTQIWDQRRLQLFDVFDEVDDFLLSEEAYLSYFPQFARYKAQMIDWVGGLIDKAALPLFAKRAVRTFAMLNFQTFLFVAASDIVAARCIYDVIHDVGGYLQRIRHR
jgi:glycosyltransferase involved in cell wall biosynthesis